MQFYASFRSKSSGACCITSDREAFVSGETPDFSSLTCMVVRTHMKPACIALVQCRCTVHTYVHMYMYVYMYVQYVRTCKMPCFTASLHCRSGTPQTSKVHVQETSSQAAVASRVSLQKQGSKKRLATVVSQK